MMEHTNGETREPGKPKDLPGGATSDATRSPPPGFQEGFHYVFLALKVFFNHFSKFFAWGLSFGLVLVLLSFVLTVFFPWEGPDLDIDLSFEDGRLGPDAFAFQFEDSPWGAYFLLGVLMPAYLKAGFACIVINHFSGRSVPARGVRVLLGPYEERVRLFFFGIGLFFIWVGLELLALIPTIFALQLRSYLGPLGGVFVLGTILACQMLVLYATFRAWFYVVPLALRERLPFWSVWRKTKKSLLFFLGFSLSFALVFLMILLVFFLLSALFPFSTELGPIDYVAAFIFSVLESLSSLFIWSFSSLFLTMAYMRFFLGLTPEQNPRFDL